MQLKELESLLKLLRRHGVLTYKSESLELSLNDVAPVAAKRYKDEAKPAELAKEWDDLTDEEKLMWSSVPATPGE